jgi:hypothetical protein
METPMPPDDAENVTRLPVQFKSQGPEGRTIVAPSEVGRAGQCSHYYGVKYIVDEAKSHVECSGCGAQLNPMWVLKRLTIKDSTFHEAAKRYQAELAELSERKRTGCEHCGKMTRITRR